jgi:hypothetical protein
MAVEDDIADRELMIAAHGVEGTLCGTTGFSALLGINVHRVGLSGFGSG